MAYFCYKGCPREKNGFSDLNRLRLHQSKCKYARPGLQQNLIAAKRKLAANAEEASAKIHLDAQHEANQQLPRDQEAESSFHPETSIGAQTDEIDTISQETAPTPVPTGRFPRVRKVPRALKDFLPHGLSQLSRPLRELAAVPSTPASLPPAQPDTPELVNHDAPTPEALMPNQSTSPSYANSPVNGFGLFRSYLTVPQLDPEESTSLEDVCEATTLATSRQNTPPWWASFGHSSLANAAKGIFAPFLNATTFRLMHWFYSGSSMKSLGELDRLVKDVLLAEDYSTEDLRNFSAAREAQRVDELDDPDASTGPFSSADGWKESTVHIRVPCEDPGQSRPETETPEFEVQGVFHRSLTEVIRATFQSPLALSYHLIPFKLYSQRCRTPSSDSSSTSPDSPPSDSTADLHNSQSDSSDIRQRVYSELFNSDAMNEEYERINSTFPPSRESQRSESTSDASCGPQPTIENVIAAMMFWSDSTHLTSFGSASLWPIYLYFGNQSKYSRSRPSEFASHHISYLPSVPSSFQDWFLRIYGVAPSADILTHCKRELMQKIWELLLDDEFRHAYEHGMLIKFADGITRRVFPRIFTYSADYPEKILLASLKFLANMPCPRCLILKSEIAGLGTKLDARRRTNKRVDDEPRRSMIERCRGWIYAGGRKLRSKAVEAYIGTKSWVPTRNAFSEKLHEFGVNFYQLFVPDLLHEFELGVWKATFIHLLRILYAAGGNKIQKLNERFRQVPTFGRDTIRRFSANVADLKKLGARDYEDILQCCIPVFEDLLPEPYNSAVLDLLWSLSMWHSLAKLRMHTTSTLTHLTNATTALGRSLRYFKKHVCAHFVTKELPRETAARGRRTAAMAAKAQASSRNGLDGDNGNQASLGRNRGGTEAGTRGRGQARGRGRSYGSGQGRELPNVPNVSESTMDSGSVAAQPRDTSSQQRTGSSRTKSFNMNTYKLHALGDYVASIKAFGPSDNYSTQIGELEHRRVKRFYSRTNKWHFVRQITKQQRREELLRRLAKRSANSRKSTHADQTMTATTGSQSSSTADPRFPGTHTTTKKKRKQIATRSDRGKDPVSLSFDDQDPLVSASPNLHHQISENNRYRIDLAPWLADHAQDRAVQDFVPRLKDHILARLAGQDYHDELEFTDEDRRSISFVGNRIYRHKVMRVNYTTYDLRRDQDSLNPRTQADIMLLGHEDDAGMDPFWYARIIGIFHVYVVQSGDALKQERIEFLWVRWLGKDPTHKSGFAARRLPRIGFVPDDDTDTFGFLDPGDVLRAVHLIPAFAHGRTNELLGPSIARQPREDDEDWQYYYVNIFVDRDMLMRYLGGGIGHRGTSTHVENSNAELDDDEETEDTDLGTSEEQAASLAGLSHSTEGPSGSAGDVADDSVEDPQPVYQDGEEDYGYESSEHGEEDDNGGEPESGDEDEDMELLDGLGAEDGEDIADMDEDLEDSEGFAPL